MTKLPLRLLTLILLTGFIFSGCVPYSPTPATPTPLPVDTATTVPPLIPSATATQFAPITLQASAIRGVAIQTWHAFSGAAADVFKQQTDLFNGTNQWGIVVNPTSYGDYPSLFYAVNNALGSASGRPDLVVALPEETLAWNASHSVVDLNPYLQDATWGLGNDAIADFPAVFWDQDRIHGVQLGVPAQRSARFLFYNQTWAHALGFSSPPQTMDEFRKQACAANASYRKDANLQNDGYGGWIVDTSWQTTYSWLLGFGGGVADGSAYGFRTDPNLAALRFIKQLFDDHCAWLSTEPTPFDSFARRSALFISGDLAEVTSIAGSMSLDKNHDEWTLIPFPGTTGRVIVAYGPSYSVLKTSPEKQLAAWVFTRWLLSPQDQAQWVEAAGLFPLRTSVLDQIGPYRSASPQWDAALDALSLAQGVPQLASWRNVRYVLEDGVDVIIRMNTPLDQIPSALTEMDAMAQELNKK
jgi:multiple sugar transport system substrate-binding protein